MGLVRLGPGHDHCTKGYLDTSPGLSEYFLSGTCPKLKDKSPNGYSRHRVFHESDSSNSHGCP
jgi:hypothetical protein